MTMSNDSFLTLSDRFGGRVAVRPNGTNSVFVDASSNSANGDDNDPRVCFITYRGKDYAHSANWQIDRLGNWTAVDPKVTLRGSFGMATAPKTYAAAILAAIEQALKAWYHLHDGAQAMRLAEVERAEMSERHAEDNLNEAREALAAAQERHSAAIARLAEARAAV